LSRTQQDFALFPCTFSSGSKDWNLLFIVGAKGIKILVWSSRNLITYDGHLVDIKMTFPLSTSDWYASASMIRNPVASTGLLFRITCRHLVLGIKPQPLLPSRDFRHNRGMTLPALIIC
jgi:hypothetical protein